MTTENFDDLKVGDTVIVTRRYWSRQEYYAAKVTKRTKTRITTKCRGQENQWNLDGKCFPRSYSPGVSSYLLKANEENIKLLKRFNLTGRIIDSSHHLYEFCRSENRLASKTQAQLEELVRAIAMFLAEEQIELDYKDRES